MGIALVASAALAACRTNELAGPGAISASQVRGRSQFNSTKYRDSGSKPVTARSGSAAVQAEVLLSKNGSATLVVTSYSATDPTTPAGTIDKLQIKVFGASGLLFTNNVNRLSGSVARIALPGPPPRVTVQVQANVSGIDRARTDVVTVAGIVPAFAPDLAVLQISAPGTAVTGVPTVIGATIAELGGQHGGRADCVLYVSGTAVDRSTGIWVDAGDAVSCAFTHSFAAAGTYALRIAAENVQPLDADPSNNSASATLAVIAASAVPAAPLSLAGDVHSGTFVSADTFETRWTRPDGTLFLDVRDDERASGTTQTFNITGTIGAALPFPLTALDVAETGDARLISSLHLTGVAQTSGGSGFACYADDDGLGTSLFLCSYGQGFSVVSLVHLAGTVTFQSTNFSKVWNGTSYDENTFVTNQTDTMGIFASMRSSFAVSVQVTSGNTIYAIGGIAALSPASESDIEPRQCATTPVSVPPLTLTAYTCTASAFIFNGFAGALSASGVTAQP